MERPALHFESLEWHVAEDGYRWLSAWQLNWDTPPSGPALYLTHGLPYTAGASHRAYYPAEKPGLFLSFAGTGGVQTAMLDFANQYGLLGAGAGHPIAAATASGNYLVPSSGEALSDWHHETTAMQQAVWFWTCAQNHDLQALRRSIIWSEKEDAVSYHYWHQHAGYLKQAVDDREPDATGLIASAHSHSARFRDFSPGDLVQPALTVVRDIITAHLAARLRPRLEWESLRNWLDTFVTPYGLVGLLWLQFATALREDHSFRQCSQCQEFFVLSEHALKTNKQFCSDACKNRAHRGRQFEAQRLSSQGVPLTEIAHQFASEEATVRRWVQAGRVPQDSIELLDYVARENRSTIRCRKAQVSVRRSSRLAACNPETLRAALVDLVNRDWLRASPDDSTIFTVTEAGRTAHQMQRAEHQQDQQHDKAKHGK